jgi:serine/threonine protein kinase
MWHMKYIYRIQHRDLKPGNILRYKKNWYGITDWGSSRLRVDSRNTLRGASMDSF